MQGSSRLHLGGFVSVFLVGKIGIIRLKDQLQTASFRSP